MKLVFLSGPKAGDEIEVVDQVVVGREKSDVEIEDTAVSRQHASFKSVDGGVEVTDLDSTNGTFVNSDRITGSKKLEHGDFVTIGSSTLEVRGDWRSAETEAIVVPPEVQVPDPSEEYRATTPIQSPPRVERPTNLRPVLIGAGALGLIIVVALFFTLGGSDNGFAKEADALCADARPEKAVAIEGSKLSTIKPAAQRLLKLRTTLRQDLAALEPEADIAAAYGNFLTKYGATNERLRRLAGLEKKTKQKDVQGAVKRVTDAARADAAAAQEVGLKVCGGLPV